MAPPTDPASMLCLSHSLHRLLPRSGPSDSTGLGLCRVGCVSRVLSLRDTEERGCCTITPTPKGGKKEISVTVDTSVFFLVYKMNNI